MQTMYDGCYTGTISNYYSDMYSTCEDCIQKLHNMMDVLVAVAIVVAFLSCPILIFVQKMNFQRLT